MIEENSLSKVTILQGSNLVIGNEHNQMNDILPGYFIIFHGESSLYFVESITNQEFSGEFQFRTIEGLVGKKNHEVEICGDLAMSLEEGSEVYFEWGDHKDIKSIHRIYKNNGKTFGIVFDIFQDNSGPVESGSGRWSVHRKVAVIKEKYPSQSRYNCDYIVGSSVTKNLKIPLIEYSHPKYKSLYWFAMQQIDSLAERLPKQETMELTKLVCEPDICCETFRKESPKDDTYIIKPRHCHDYKITKMYISCQKGAGIISFFKNDERFDLLNVTADGYERNLETPVLFQKNEPFKISVKNIQEIEGLIVYFEFIKCN